jgi:hypothetical protein
MNNNHLLENQAIMQYGKTIKDKISSERNGEITGVACNVLI